MAEKESLLHIYIYIYNIILVKDNHLYSLKLIGPVLHEASHPFTYLIASL